MNKNNEIINGIVKNKDEQEKWENPYVKELYKQSNIETLGLLKNNNLLCLKEKYITNEIKDDFTDDFIIYKQVKYYKSNRNSKINYKHKEICLGYSLESVKNTYLLPEDFKVYKKQTIYKKGYAYSYFIFQKPIPEYLARKYNLEKITNRNEYYKDIKKQKNIQEETKLKLEREMTAYSKKKKKEKEHSR